MWKGPPKRCKDFFAVNRALPSEELAAVVKWGGTEGTTQVRRFFQLEEVSQRVSTRLFGRQKFIENRHQFSRGWVMHPDTMVEQYKTVSAVMASNLPQVINVPIPGPKGHRADLRIGTEVVMTYRHLDDVPERYRRYVDPKAPRVLHVRILNIGGLYYQKDAEGGFVLYPHFIRVVFAPLGLQTVEASDLANTTYLFPDRFAESTLTIDGIPIK